MKIILLIVLCVFVSGCNPSDNPVAAEVETIRKPIVMDASPWKCKQKVNGEVEVY